MKISHGPLPSPFALPECITESITLYMYIQKHREDMQTKKNKKKKTKEKLNTAYLLLTFSVAMMYFSQPNCQAAALLFSIMPKFYKVPQPKIDFREEDVRQWITN